MYLSFSLLVSPHRLPSVPEHCDYLQFGWSRRFFSERHLPLLRPPYWIYNLSSLVRILVCGHAFCAAVVTRSALVLHVTPPSDIIGRRRISPPHPPPSPRKRQQKKKQQQQQQQVNSNSIIIYNNNNNDM